MAAGALWGDLGCCAKMASFFSMLWEGRDEKGGVLVIPHARHRFHECAFVLYCLNVLLQGLLLVALVLCRV